MIIAIPIIVPCRILQKAKQTQTLDSFLPVCARVDDDSARRQLEPWVTGTDVCSIIASLWGYRLPI